MLGRDKDMTQIKYINTICEDQEWILGKFTLGNTMCKLI